MNIWLVRSGDGVFEYSKFIDSDSLLDINIKLKTFNFSNTSDINTHIINGNDMSLLRSVGGTVLFREKIGWVIIYLIDLKFDRVVDSRGEEIFFRFSEIRKSVIRDIKLNEIII